METKIAYEPLDAERIKGSVTDIPISVLREVDSTNTEARRRLLAGEPMPQAILAEAQTAGRGRMGRSFYSPEGTGIYLTLCFPAGTEDPLFLTTAAAVAIHRAISRVTGISCDIKWVNDLYFKGRKVSGILAESLFLGDVRYIILGVGVNLYTSDFPSELLGIAGGLAGAPAGIRNDLAAEMLRELSALMPGRMPSGWLDLYRAHSMVLGKPIVYTENGICHEAVAESIDEKGRLTVRLANGKEQILASGEISLRVMKEREKETWHTDV